MKVLLEMELELVEDFNKPPTDEQLKAAVFNFIHNDCEYDITPISASVRHAIGGVWV